MNGPHERVDNEDRERQFRLVGVSDDGHQNGDQGIQRRDDKRGAIETHHVHRQIGPGPREQQQEAKFLADVIVGGPDQQEGGADGETKEG